MTHKSLFILIPLLTLFLAGCSTKDGIILYNPTATFVTVTINENVYKVGSNEQVEISLSSGTTKIKCETATDVLMDTTIEVYWKDIEDGAMLNVTGTPLYLLGEKYGDENTYLLGGFKAMFELDSAMLVAVADPEYRELFVEALVTSSGSGFYDPTTDKSVVIEPYLLIGDIEEYPAGQVVIPKRWDFGPKEDFADEVEVNADGLESAIGATRKKIFSQVYLVSYYFENYFITIPEDTATAVPL